jgi:hypothetical protein
MMKEILHKATISNRNTSCANFNHEKPTIAFLSPILLRGDTGCKWVWMLKPLGLLMGGGLLMGVNERNSQDLQNIHFLFLEEFAIPIKG